MSPDAAPRAGLGLTGSRRSLLGHWRRSLGMRRIGALTAWRRHPPSRPSRSIASGAPDSSQPHRSETFELSVDPPEKARVVCVYDKSQIQALDRTKPLLPMRSGQVEQRTNEDERHGTATPFPSFTAGVNGNTNVKPGTVIGKFVPRHRTREFRIFFEEIERNAPEGIDIHIVMDNASSHKTTLIHDWLAKRLCWRMHFTLTSSFWINQVKPLFALFADKQIKRGAHRLVKALIHDFEEYVARRNADLKLLRWTKSTGDILSTIESFCRQTPDVCTENG